MALTQHRFLPSLLPHLTSTLGVGALLLHRGREVGLSRLLLGSVGLHTGLTPAPLPAVVAVLMAAVVSVLATAPVSVPCPGVAAVVGPMFLDLPLGQQACGLPSAGASLVFLVLPIELPNDQLTIFVFSSIRHEHAQVAPETVRMRSVFLLAAWQRRVHFKIRQHHVLSQTALMETETWTLPLDLSQLDRLHENCPGHLGKRLILLCHIYKCLGFTLIKGRDSKWWQI